MIESKHMLKISAAILPCAAAIRRNLTSCCFTATQGLRALVAVKQHSRCEIPYHTCDHHLIHTYVFFVFLLFNPYSYEDAM